MSQEPPEKMMFQLALRRRGISDQAVLRTMEEVPREVFVAAGDRGHAYRDSALGIACGQTISQPFVVAYMTEQLQLQKGHKVLEIGTGSGYQAAVLSRLCAHVLTIERYRTLADTARDRLEALGYFNIEVMLGDGFDIPAGAGDFDRIIVTAAMEKIPEKLQERLLPRRHPDRTGRPASRHPDAGPGDQDGQRFRAQGIGRCPLRPGPAGNCARAVESRIGGSRQHLIPRVKRLFTRHVFTQNSILLRTSE